jgi:hypothetical protein
VQVLCEAHVVAPVEGGASSPDDLHVLRDIARAVSAARSRGLGAALHRLELTFLQQLTFSQRLSNATAAPQPGFVELSECLPYVLLALSTASQELMRLIEFRAQLRDVSTQEFELGVLFVTQFDAPIPSLIGLSHRPIFAVRAHRPARQ